MDQREKVRENRLRRMAKRQGVAVVKSRRRDPRALDFGGYGIIDPQRNAWLAGADHHAFELSLDQVEDWLTREPQ